MNAVRLALLSVLLVGGLVACKSTGPRSVLVLSTSRLAADFGTYKFHRVGVLPVEGDLEDDAAVHLQQDLYTELSRSTPYELVTLSKAELFDVRKSEPLRRGAHTPESLVEISRRYRLDAILFSDVPHRRLYPPLELSLQSELVASDTGQVVWAGSVHLDASDERVRHGLEGFFSRDHDAEDGGAGWELALLSPTRFARFAAYQIALQL